MRQTEMNRPFPLFVAPHGRTATVEVLLVVDPEQTLLPGDLEEVLEEVMRRVDRALSGIFDSLPGEVTAEDISAVNPQHVPFFPAIFGGQVLRDQVEVYEALQKLRAGTALEGPLYDSAGRAFEVVVWASFRRDREKDRRVAELWTLDSEEPPPDKLLRKSGFPD